MLTEKELMIGDWVMYNPNVFIDDEYETAKEWFPTQINSGEDIDLAIEGCYDSIPLTPEILEKIGFSTEPNIGYIIDDYDGTQIIYDSWNHILRIIKNYKTCLDIRTFGDLSVHELQHALRLLDIEKEIEL